MTDKPKNPPAFPSFNSGAGDKNYSDGMALRDYFAGQALPAILENVANTSNLREVAFGSLDDNARVAYYNQADAMLRARQS